MKIYHNAFKRRKFLKKFSKLILIILVLAFGGAVWVYAAPPVWLTGTTDEQLKKLADIQPGLGTVMIEYSTRYTNTYYAAKGGNWDLAAYQLKEALEIQEVGETTRPSRAAALKAFETTYITPISDAITAKDFTAFKTAFKDGIKGCNACHASQTDSATGKNFSFIKYKLPKAPLSPLSTKP